MEVHSHQDGDKMIYNVLVLIHQYPSAYKDVDFHFAMIPLLYVLIVLQIMSARDDETLMR